MKQRWLDAPRSFACTAIAWVAIAVMRSEYLAHLVLGFAVLALLPLGLALALENGAPHEKEVPFAYRLAVTLLPGLVLGGFFLFWGPAGSLPAAMATGGVALFCCTAPLLALSRLLRRKNKRGPELAVDFGLSMLLPAVVWLFASRLGLPLLGFHEPTVLLTAEHFFHAGFAAPLLFGVLGRHVDAEHRRLCGMHRLATVIVCAAMPLTALGIATSRTLEVPAALLLAAGMVIGAAVLLEVAWRARTTSLPAAGLLALSGVSLAVGMVFATAWALTGKGADAVAGSAFSTLDEMVKWHGAVNSGGFLGAGLLGLSLLEIRKKR